MGAKWYKCVQLSHRAYVLIGEEIVMNVNAFVRLPEPVLFEPVGSEGSSQEGSCCRANSSDAAVR